MSVPTRKVRAHWVRESARIAALGSLVRQRIMDRLEAIGPASVRELADELGVAPDRLYYHVRALETHGHVAVAGDRGEGRNREVLYDLVHRRWHIAYDLDDADNAAAIRKLTAAMVRQAQRDFDAGFTHPDAEVAGPARNLWSLRLEASLTSAELRELNRHLRAIVDLLRRSDRRRSRRRGGHLISLSWLLAPLENRR